MDRDIYIYKKHSKILLKLENDLNFIIEKIQCN